MTRAALALAAILLVGALVPLVAMNGGPVRALLVDRVATDALPPPPTLRLLTPQEGDGVAGALVLAGEARSEKGRILDVQVRLDGATWKSLPDAPRGASASPFRVQLRVPDGDHVVEARASDGDAWSLPTRVHVRAGAVAPPTVRIVSPSEGDGLAAGSLEVLGTVSGPGPWSVVVTLDGTPYDATVHGGDREGALWSVTLDLLPGEHRIVAAAQGLGGWSLDQRIRVAANGTAPPTLVMLRPQPGDAFGSAGDDACPSSCVLVGGLATGPAPIADVLVGLDDGPLVPLGEVGGTLTTSAGQAAWTWRADVTGLYSGPHVVRAVALDEEGRRGVERSTPFMLRTQRVVSIEGDDAPAPTGTPLTFRAAGLDEDAIPSWTLDGVALTKGKEATITLAGPGGHTLALLAPDAAGRARMASVPLYALDRPPVVTLSAEPGVATRPLLLTATATDPDGEVVRYAWAFGDGDEETTEEGAVLHTFPDAGSYDVRVTAFDDHGASATATRRILVGNAEPTAGFAWSPERPTVLDDVTFTDRSLDPEGRLVVRSWDFGDGARASGPSAMHRFSTRGDHQVTLAVEDAEGSAAIVAATVHVANVPPTAGLSSDPPFPATGDAVTFTDLSTKPDGAIVSWRWDFGDGMNSTSRNVAHAYAKPGRYLVTLTVVDDAGATGLATTHVVVADAAPLVRAIAAQPAAPDALEPVRFEAATSDVEGNVTRIEWDFGDGSTSTEATPVHSYLRSGTYDVTVAAYDAVGQRGVLNHTVRVRNLAPLIELGSVEGLVTGLATRVGANASDPDGEIARYAFDMDGDGVAECVTTTPLCAHAYREPGTFLLEVTVEDDEGATASAARLVDVRAASGDLPLVDVARPLAGATLRSETLLEGSATGVAPIESVEVQLRRSDWSEAAAAGGWTPTRGTSEWRLILDTRAYQDGAYDLVVRATDTAGNVGHARVPIVLANGRGAEVTVRVVNLARDQLLAQDLTVRGTAYHPEGVTNVRWRIDEGAWQDAGGTQLAWAIPLAVADLPPGPHVLHVEGFRNLLDRAAVDVPFTVPDVAPALVVEQAPAPTLYARVHAEGRVSDGATALWRIDSGVWQEAQMGGPRFIVDAPTADTQNGPHVVQLKAYDPRTGLQTQAVTFPVRVINPDLEQVARSGAAPDAPRETPVSLLAPLAFLAAFLMARRPRS